MNKNNPFGGQHLPASVGFWRWIFTDQENALSIILPMAIWGPITAGITLTTTGRMMWCLLALLAGIGTEIWLRAYLLWRRNLKLEAKQ